MKRSKSFGNQGVQVSFWRSARSGWPQSHSRKKTRPAPRKEAGTRGQSTVSRHVHCCQHDSKRFSGNLNRPWARIAGSCGGLLQNLSATAEERYPGASDGKASPFVLARAVSLRTRSWAFSLPCAAPRKR
jgi:hypothetical protein